MQPRLQTDLSRKIQQARQAGFNDQQIQAYLALRQPQQAAQPTSQPKTRGRGGTATSLISEASGTGGALAGAAAGAGIGSFAGPIGTVIGGGIGGLIGGFGGGFGGRAVENLVRDDEARLSEALGEGVTSGLFGAVGGVGRGLQGAKALKSASTASKAATSSKAGSRLSQYGSGVKIAPQPGGVKGAQSSARFAADFTGTPRTQLKKLDTEMSRLGSQVDDILSTSKAKINGSSVRSRVANVNDDLFNDLDLLDPNVNRKVTSLVSKFDNAKNPKEINDQLKTIQSLASRANKKLATPNSAPLTAAEQAALAVKRSADDVLGAIEEIQPLKQRMAQIYQLYPDVTKASEKVFKLPIFGTPIPGVSQGAMGIASRAGGVAQRGAEATGAGVAKQLATGTALRGANNQINQLSAQMSPVDTLAQDLGTLDQTTGQFTQAGMGGQMQQPQQSRLTEEQINQAILLDLAETGGENIEAIQMIAEMYGPQAAEEVDPEVQSLTNSVQLLLDNFAVAGSGQGAGGLAQSVLGRTPGLRSLGGAQNAQVFEDQRKALIAPLARAISGEVGVLTDRDISRAEGLLPRLSDPPEVAQRKINDLMTLIQQAGGAGTPTDTGALTTGDLAQ